MKIFKSALMTAALAGTMLAALPAFSQGTYQFQVPVQGLDVEAELTFKKISGGMGYFCGLTSASSVMCWGYNADGQLGNGTNANSSLPVQVVGLESGVADIEAGFGHVCAVTTAGEAKCWGANASGQLGNGTTVKSSVPVTVSGLGAGSGVTQISASRDRHTCATTSSGAAYCWGANYAGQLGDNTLTTRTTPIQVTAAGVVAQITTGTAHSCAVTTSGSMRCWGRNDNGQIGDGTKTMRKTPTLVQGLTSGVQMAEGGINNTCAIVSGAAMCWGLGSDGSLGNGAKVESLTPVMVSGLDSNVTAISTGGNSCAIVSGSVKCWGLNQRGQLGNGTNVQSLVPVSVVGLPSNAVSLSASPGYWTQCAVVKGGKAYCWGWNELGQLGNGSTTDTWTPTLVKKE